MTLTPEELKNIDMDDIRFPSVWDELMPYKIERVSNAVYKYYKYRVDVTYTWQAPKPAEWIQINLKLDKDD